MNADRLANYAIAAAAVLIAWVAIDRLRATPPGIAESGTEPVYLEDWRDLLKDGHWVGDSNAKTVVLEFSDFECPYCARFHAVLDSLMRADSADVALYYRHYPIEGHRFAVPAARASDCAALYGRFSAMHDLLFRKQDSLGLKTWWSYAQEAGMTDSAGFTACVANPREPERVVAGRKAGEAIRVSATPTVIIQGWRYSIPPYATLPEEVMRRADGSVE